MDEEGTFLQPSMQPKQKRYFNIKFIFKKIILSSLSLNMKDTHRL